MFYVYRAYTSIGSRTLPVLLPIHIVAAGLGLVSGAVALSAAKGGRLHRRSGTLFAYAIFAMCGTAVVSAVVKGQAVNVMAGSMTAYLVFTGVATVRIPLLRLWVRTGIDRLKRAGNVPPAVMEPPLQKTAPAICLGFEVWPRRGQEKPRRPGNADCK